MRLEDVLFTQGFGTRHECRGLIALGRVTFDGREADDPDETVDPVGKVFTVDDTEWPYHEKALIVLNKPAGYECSQKPLHHPSVMQLLPPPLRVRGLQPVGRLDEDTTGLLLLTDDGALIHRLTHPKKHVAKTYEVSCKHPVTDAMIEKLLEGVMIEGEKVPVAAVRCEKTGETTMRMAITAGKYHQVKRMTAAVGNRVEMLSRSKFGAFKLPEDLPERSWRWLTAEEAKAVQQKNF